MTRTRRSKTEEKSAYLKVFNFTNSKKVTSNYEKIFKLKVEIRNTGELEKRKSVQKKTP